MFHGCRMQWASGAALKSTIALEVGTGAHRFGMYGCKVYGTATHNVTDGVKVVAAVNDLEIVGCRMVASATAANGLIHFTAAALNLLIEDCTLYNTHTSSTSTIRFDNVAADGMISHVRSGTKNDGTASAQGITYAGTNVLVVQNECYSVDEPRASGILNPAAGT
jgi:hypothetical protein